MFRAAALAAGRRAAEQGMVDTCAITRVAATSTNPTTGAVTETPTAVYSGRCRLQQREVQGNRVDVGETSVILLRLELQLPMSVVGLQEGDQVTAVTSASDPDLVGRIFRIRDLAHKTDATARRVQITEVTS